MRRHGFRGRRANSERELCLKTRSIATQSENNCRHKLKLRPLTLERRRQDCDRRTKDHDLLASFLQSKLRVEDLACQDLALATTPRPPSTRDYSSNSRPMTKQDCALSRTSLPMCTSLCRRELTLKQPERPCLTKVMLPSSHNGSY